MGISKAIRSGINLTVVRLVCLIPEQTHLRTKAEYAYHWLTYLYRHKRVPRTVDGGFNDFLFLIKSNGTLKAPLRCRVTDKEFGKDYINAQIGNNWTIDTITVMKSRTDVTQFSPPTFPIVLKPTHSSGRMFVAHSEVEYASAIPTLQSWLKHDYFWHTIEHNYRGLERKIIVEPYIDKTLFLEGSIHCRDGKVKIISMIDRFDVNKRRTSLDRSWRPLHVALGQPYTPLDIDRPVYLDELINKAEAICQPFNYLRLDFYASADRFVFGELTNLPGGGLSRFSSKDGERRFSEAFFS